MSDNPTVVATPYPTYMTGGNDDDSYRAALVSHSSASVERNQDASFAHLSRQHLQGRASDGRRESVETKYEVVIAQKDAEIRALERFAELKVDLAQIRAEGVARDSAALARELSDAKASAHQDKTAQLLAAILAKLSTP